MSFSELKDLDINRWIHQNIKMKERDEQSRDEKPYDLVPTNCFGDIDFKETTKRSKGKFIRFSEDTQPACIFELMTTFWELEKPRLLISVTGGAKELKMDYRLQQNFKDGLLKLTETPGTWIISGGTNTGIMKLVGDAMHGTNNTCIGIVSWGIVAKKECLIPTKGTKHGTSFPYRLGSYLLEKGAVFLDRNHTHFLMVDDGSKGTFGVEIPFRAKFEEYITESLKDKVPTVLLVLEGGPGTLDTVASAVANENPVPVVLVKNSGRVADLLINALSISEEITKWLDNKERGNHPGVMREIENIFSGLKKEEMEKIYNQIIVCVKMKEKFTITDMCNEMDVDDTILISLLNGHKTSSYEQLKLAILWDRADLGEQKILCPMKEWKDNPIELQELMIMSLAMNRVNFVKLLLDYGISINTLLTNEVLQFLYAFRSRMKDAPILTKERRKKTHVKVNDWSSSKYRSIFKYLLLNASIDLDAYEGIPRNDIEEILQRCTEIFIRCEDNTLTEGWKEETYFEYPFRELFFWAVLNNMLEMAIFLWEFEEEAMAKALIAAEISNVLLNLHSESLDLQDELSASLSKSTSTFNNLALQLLDTCYNCDKHLTEKFITSNLVMLPTKTCLDLAISSKHKAYISHSAVQGILNEVWTGDLKSRSTRTSELLPAFFCPYLLKYMKFKSKKEKKNMIEAGGSVVPVDCADGQMCNQIEPDIPFYKKIYEFYIETPVIKFYEHVIGYLLFLGLFSYVAMLNKDTTRPSHWEFLLIGTAFGYMVDEIYQLSHIDAPTMKRKVVTYITDFWNMLDGVCIIFFIIALSLRAFPFTLQVGHLFYAITCSLWTLRFLRVFYIHPISGPYVVMIGKMFRDMMYFLCILIVFLLSYGIAVTAMLKPEEGSVLKLVYSIFHPYFNIYGELFLDRDPGSNTTTRFGTTLRDAYSEPIALIYLAGYLLVANILLLNLLIAIFNHTYVRVMENAAEVWKCKRYALILEFSQQRIALVPPFNLLGHLFLFVRWLFMQCGLFTKYKFQPGLRSCPTDEQKETLRELEYNCLVKLMRKNVAEEIMYCDLTASNLMERDQNISHAMGDTRSRKSVIMNESMDSTLSIQDRLKQIEDTNIDLNSTMKAVEETLRKMETANGDPNATLLI